MAEQEWTPGDRLPSRAQIAEECGVRENVVRRAQELLISQGALEGRAGSGTYVAAPRRRAPAWSIPRLANSPVGPRFART
nr:GntR family transcriptional regulator [Streptomyces caniferus]